VKIYSLKRQQIIKRSEEEVFSFFDKPENLSVITPPSLGFAVLTPLPVKMKNGALIHYTIKVAGIRVHWRTMITTYEPPHRFVDEQLKGPYAFWHHTHTFNKIENGTEIIDQVRYAIPLGVIGRLMHALFIKRQLKKIFDYRARAIALHFSHNSL
jgi:ligand-binding SRPBCC domain-containing protein